MKCRRKLKLISATKLPPSSLLPPLSSLHFSSRLSIRSLSVCEATRASLDPTARAAPPEELPSLSRLNFDRNQPRSDLIQEAIPLFQKAEETAFTNAEVLIQVHVQLYSPSTLLPPSPPPFNTTPSPLVFSRAVLKVLHCSPPLLTAPPLNPSP